MEKISKVSWLSKSDEGGVIKQGLGLSKQGLFLSDLFEEITAKETIPDHVKKKFPSLSQEDYNSGVDMIWYLLSSIQYWGELSSVENNGILDPQESKKMLDGYERWMRNFEIDPW